MRHKDRAAARVARAKPCPHALGSHSAWRRISISRRYYPPVAIPGHSFTISIRRATPTSADFPRRHPARANRRLYHASSGRAVIDGRASPEAISISVILRGDYESRPRSFSLPSRFCAYDLHLYTPPLDKILVASIGHHEPQPATGNRCQTWWIRKSDSCGEAYSWGSPSGGS